MRAIRTENRFQNYCEIACLGNNRRSSRRKRDLYEICRTGCPTCSDIGRPRGQITSGPRNTVVRAADCRWACVSPTMTRRAATRCCHFYSTQTCTGRTAYDDTVIRIQTGNRKHVSS